MNESFKSPYCSLMVAFGITAQASFNPTKILGRRGDSCALEGDGAQDFDSAVRVFCLTGTSMKNASHNPGEAGARH